MYIILPVGTTYALVGLRHTLVDLFFSAPRDADQFPWILTHFPAILCIQASMNQQPENKPVMALIHPSMLRQQHPFVEVKGKLYYLLENMDLSKELLRSYPARDAHLRGLGISFWPLNLIKYANCFIWSYFLFLVFIWLSQDAYESEMKQCGNSPNSFKHTELSESEIQKLLLNFKMKMYDFIFTTLNFFFPIWLSLLDLNIKYQGIKRKALALAW